MYTKIYLLLMALFLVVLVLKPEIGIEIKKSAEKLTCDAEWTPSRGTRWRFVITGVFIEIIFIVLIGLHLRN